MCAIAGIFKPNTNADVSQKTLLQMLAAMDHRGPDNKGIWQNDAGLSLGHCRLSILDLDTRSNQPMVSSDNRYLVVYNGEIYNYDEIAERLQRFGVVFRTTSDTEVLLKGLIYFGVDFHSTWQDIYYTIDSTSHGNMPGLVPNMIVGMAKELGLDPNIRPNKMDVPSINSSRYFFETFGAEALTYEIGDDTPRDLLKKKGEVSAKELMRLLLELEN